MNARLAALALSATFVLAAAPAPARAAAPACKPEPAVAAIEAEVGDLYDLVGLPPDAWTEAMARVEAALAERPGDLFLHRLRQELVEYGPKDVAAARMPALRQEYARLAAEHPDDPVFHYLHGVIALDDAEREAAFSAAVAADPDWPWGHFGMVSVELWREEPDPEAAERHLRRFAELCPDNLQELLSSGRLAGSSAFWSARLPEIRRRLRAAPGEHADLYPPLWATEFRLTDVTEHDAVRARVAEDLEALAAVDPKPRKVWFALKKGYELSGRSEAAAEVEAELRAASPCSPGSAGATIDAWEEEHPRPPAEAPEQERVSWNRIRAAAAREWVERCPDGYAFWRARLQAYGALDDEEPAELVRIGERVAELYARWLGYSFPSGYEEVAQVYVDRKVALDRVPGLLDRAEAELASLREQMDLGRYPDERREKIERGDRQAAWLRDLLRARARIGRGELTAAKALLDELASRLEEIAPPADASGLEHASLRGLESELWVARADLAEAAGRLLDAVSYLLRAEAARPAGAPSSVHGLRPAEAEERIPELWARLDGTPEALAALREMGSAGRAAAELADLSPWQDASGTLPPFELKDLSGRVWTASDLAGKTVFANAWATWCGPCREELPAVQALHDKLAGRDDVVVLTLNMDLNTGAVAPYLARKELDLPVLLALDYLRDDLDVFSIPKNWIVDATGVLRREQSGFDASLAQEEWIAEALDEMERVAATAGPAGPR